MDTFKELKNRIINEGTQYLRKYHTYYQLYKSDNESHEVVNISYNHNQYPAFEKIIDFQKNIVYKKTQGIIEEYEYKGYETIYFLVIDGHFIMESENPNNLWEYVAKNYQLSIDYYGSVLPTEIMKREYTDSHEGNECFITDVANEITGQTINIQVQDIMYIDDYLDDKDMRQAFDEYIEYCEEN